MSRRTEFLRDVRRVVVKVGSQVLAPDGFLDEDVLDDLCADIVELRSRDLEVVLVSSGAVAAGRRELGLERVQTIPQKQASAAAGQMLVLSGYGERLKRAGQSVAQILLTDDDMRDRRRFLNARNTFQTLLSLGLVPIVNENDTVSVDEIKLGDNDRLSALVANLVDAELLVVLTDVDGFHAEDPRTNPEANRYSFLEEIVDRHTEEAGPSVSGVGLGGMATKLIAARQAARSGTATVIARGTEARVLEKIVDGEEVGTWIAAGRGIGARKHWIAYSSEVRGSIEIDSGAVAALVERKKSLLPSGISGVEGEFSRGATVRILSSEGREIARGLAGYSSDDLRTIRGRHSGDIEATLGYKYLDEAVHRDNLVLISDADRAREPGPVGGSPP